MYIKSLCKDNKQVIDGFLIQLMKKAYIRKSKLR